MPNYVVEFVCTRNGVRTNGRLPMATERPIPSLADAQQHLTAWVTGTLTAETGDPITELTITNIQFA